MRSYVIDEIRPSEMDKIKGFLKENTLSATLENLFWVNIPDDILNDIQFQHHDCRPHAFAVELGDNWVRFEFFIRSLNTMQCTCPGYGTRQQRDFIIHFAHTMIEQLQIKT
jgi:hypothetical protein